MADCPMPQADWTSWHELTICYQAIGWTLVDRKVVGAGDAPENHWPVVLATLEKPTLEKATLVFSMFGQDGTPLVCPFSGIPQEKETATEKTITKKVMGNLTKNLTKIHSS